MTVSFIFYLDVTLGVTDKRSGLDGNITSGNTISCSNGLIKRRKLKNHHKMIPIRTIMLCMIVAVLLMMFVVDATFLPKQHAIMFLNRSSIISDKSCRMRQKYVDLRGSVNFIRGGGGGGGGRNIYNNGGDDGDNNWGDENDFHERNTVRNRVEKKKRLFGPISKIFQMKDELISDISSSTSSSDRSQLLANLGGGGGVATASPPQAVTPEVNLHQTTSNIQNKSKNLNKQESHNHQIYPYNSWGTMEEPMRDQSFEDESDYIATREGEYEYEYEYDEDVFMEDEKVEITDEYGVLQRDGTGEGYNFDVESIDVSSNSQNYENIQDTDVLNEDLKGEIVTYKQEDVSVSSNRLVEASSPLDEEDVQSYYPSDTVEEEISVVSDYSEQKHASSFVPDFSQLSHTRAMDEEEIPVSSEDLNDKVSFLGEESLHSSSRLSETVPTEEQDEEPKDSGRVEDYAAEEEKSRYVSSGGQTIDKVETIGMPTNDEAWVISHYIRSVRKAAASVTGMHGFISGKGKKKGEIYNIDQGRDEHAYQREEEHINDEDLGVIRRRLAAIETARKTLPDDLEGILDLQKPSQWKRPFARIVNKKRQAVARQSLTATTSMEGMKDTLPNVSEVITAEELQQMQRIKEIDLLMIEGKKKMLELQIEKDDLQRRPNPLFNYTKPNTGSKKELDFEDEGVIRSFNFPPDDIVIEYIENLFAHGRLKKLNHTSLWFDMVCDWDEEDNIDVENMQHRNNGGKSRGGSWLLRQTLGKGSSLGEKIGVAAEDAAYKGVCSSIMSMLAQSLSALHGLNVMSHSDIRLFLESSTELPSTSKKMFYKDNYAQVAIGEAIRSGSKKKRKRGFKHDVDSMNEDTFIQRDAVVETLISHCQISAPLLKFFPIAFQRALLGNIITLVTAIVSDFCEGVQFEILGHQLSFSFKPITEADMIQHIGMRSFRSNQHRSKPEEFEAAVRATAKDISKGLSFLDRWHERALGGDMLRAQLGNLIARLVLTLVDEILVSARMDLWCSQARGPRIVGCLEHRTGSTKDKKAS